MKIKVFWFLGIFVLLGCSSGPAKTTVAEAGEEEYDPSFVAVNEIDNWDRRYIGWNGLFEVGVPFSLDRLIDDQGVRPQNATNRNIVWIVKEAGSTGATLVGDILTASVPGTVTFAATVQNGLGRGRDYSREWVVPVTGQMVTRGDYNLRNAEQGWLIERYRGREVNVVIPANLEITELGPDAFSTGQVTSVVVPEGVTKIFGGAFSNSNLRSVSLPSTLRYLQGGAFNGAEKLESMSIPFGVTTIGSYTFWNCKALTSITIPASVTSIERDAFGRCSALTSIIIPESVTLIGANSLFSGREGGIFGDCTELTSITVRAVEPPRMADNHYDLWWNPKPDSAIYVPSRSVNAYKNANGWKNYSNFIKGF